MPMKIRIKQSHSKIIVFQKTLFNSSAQTHITGFVSLLHSTTFPSAHPHLYKSTTQIISPLLSKKTLPLYHHPHLAASPHFKNPSLFIRKVSSVRHSFLQVRRTSCMSENLPFSESVFTLINLSETGHSNEADKKLTVFLK